jgi:hypothetical protein
MSVCASPSIAVAGGMRLAVRAICAGDRDAQSSLLARMSAESRHMRFLTSKTRLMNGPRAA